MDKQKKKVAFFEGIEITDPEYAQKVYDKENSRFKFKLVCAGMALIASICGFVMVNVHSDMGFLSSLMGFLWLLGMIATVIAGSLLNFFKIVLKFGQVAYYLVPFVLIDVVCFVFGAVIGFVVCLMFPVVPCAITLYQSYQNLKDTKDYLALYYHEATTVQSSQE